MEITFLNKYGIPIDFIETLRRNGYLRLYPPQQLAIEKGALDFKNLLITAPTASGKTLIAIIASLKHLLNKGKVLYMCPLRALASEKYYEFKELLGGFRIALSIGDYDSEDAWLKNYDVIISTYEKTDSLLRHRARWIDEVSLFIIDEIHLLDSDRGSTLEFLVARLKRRCPDSQFIALSATIKNVGEVSEWLGAETVTSSWRPVPLREGVYRNGVIYYKDGSTRKIQVISGRPFIDLSLDIISEGGQALIFNSTRANAMQNAERLKEFIKKYLTKYEIEELKELSDEIEESDRISQTLKDQIKNGVAFHHAGLSFNARSIVEKGFRNSLIKVVSATTTLGAGINVPARRVIINEIARYSVGLGYSERLTVNEYKQLAGRAGRPKYDSYGEAIIIARGKYDIDILIEEYLKAETEPISSRINDEKSLRSHILSLIANEIVTNEEELNKILNETFAARQIGILRLSRLAHRVLDFLNDASFIVKKDGFIATPLGKRVSELYIDPLSAEQIVKGLRNAPPHRDELYYLFLISSTEDMQSLNVFRGEYKILKEELERYAKALNLDIDYEDEGVLSAFKTSKMLYDWINEVREDEIADKYGIGLGDVFNVVQIASWICHAAKEISKIIRLPECYRELEDLEQRIESGVKKELLELVKIPKIGRVRARILYNAGYRTLEKLATAKEDDLIKLPMIGVETAKIIKEYFKNRS